MPETTEPAYWTAAMARELPDDGRRYEVVHGELLVTPAPRAPHQLVVQRLHLLLAAYLESEPVGIAWLSPADLSWDPGTLLQPDLFVVDPAEARTLDWAAMQHLLLVIEVLSPSTARADRFTKRRRYQEARVPLYWIVDPERERVEIWVPDAVEPVLEPQQLTWHPAGARQPLRIKLPAVFRPL